MHVLEMGVHCVSVVLHHFPTYLALERLALSLAPAILLLVLHVADVMFVLNVSIEGASIVENSWAEGAVEEGGGAPGQGD